MWTSQQEHNSNNSYHSEDFHFKTQNQQLGYQIVKPENPEMYDASEEAQLRQC
jgi:hypothetical protein